MGQRRFGACFFEPSESTLRNTCPCPSLWARILWISLRKGGSKPCSSTTTATIPGRSLPTSQTPTSLTSFLPVATRRWWAASGTQFVGEGQSQFQLCAVSILRGRKGCRSNRCSTSWHRSLQQARSRGRGVHQIRDSWRGADGQFEAGASVLSPANIPLLNKIEKDPKYATFPWMYLG